MFKAIFFDYDDTIVESYPARVLAATRAADGTLDPSLDLDRIMRERAGVPQAEIFADLSGSEEAADRLMKEYRKWYWRISPEEVGVFDGVFAMLDGLKAMSAPLAIVTSKARLMEDEDGPYGAAIEMARLGLDGIFDVLVGHEDVQRAKPDPAPVIFAAERFGVSPSEVLMVGDSHVDVTAAKRAGARAAGAAWGCLARGLLEAAGPDYMLESPSDLLALLERLDTCRMA